MKKCWIMKGIPGSGKDTWITKNLRRDIYIVSADFFHMMGSQYVYRKENAAKAHDSCLLEFLQAIQDGEPVAVNNTNIKIFEIAPYYRLAEAHGYEVEIVHILADPEVCKKRNIHGVPPETIDAMFKGIEPLPLWWKVKVVMSS